MIIGSENQYALCSNSLLTPDEKNQLTGDIAKSVALTMPTVQYVDQGVLRIAFMICNGSKISQEYTSYVEIATPEARTPFEVLLYQRADELILLQSLSKMSQLRERVIDVKLIKASTDYHDHYRGFHINCMTQNWTSEFLVEHLTPFLVTRFYSCAGGFGQSGFNMSQKHRAIKKSMSTNTHVDRGIVNIGQKTIGSYGKRIHISHGDSCMSELSTFLSVGVTALVVKMLDDGVCVGPAYKLLDPIEALRGLDADFTWTKPLRLASGLSASPLKIQEHYLKAAEIYAKQGKILWVEEVVRLWRQTLDTLKTKGPQGLCRVLDPYIKAMLYSEYLKKYGLSLTDFSKWCALIALAQPYLPEKYKRDIRGWLCERMPYVDFHLLEDQMNCNGFEWSKLPKAANLYSKMLVLDILFHDIHPHGIYHSLCRAGIVDKQAQLLNDFDVDEAMRSAPAGTRAEARGKAISEAAKDPGVMADWTMVRSNTREARFENPYESKYSWRELQKSKGK